MGTLLSVTLKLLKNRPITLTLKKISKDTSIPYHWLTAISKSNGARKPDVNHVQKLYEYLSKRELEL